MRERHLSKKSLINKIRKNTFSLAIVVILMSLITCSVALAINLYTSSRTNHFEIADLEGTVDSITYEVFNESTMPAVVRVMILPIVTLTDGTDTYLLSNDILNPGTLASGWMDGGDGYYYYTKPLNAQTSVKVLDTAPAFVSPVPADFTGAVVNLEIKAEFSSAAKYDINQYAYRNSWFNGTSPAGSLLTIDALIKTEIDQL